MKYRVPTARGEGKGNFLVLQGNEINGFWFPSPECNSNPRAHEAVLLDAPPSSKYEHPKSGSIHSTPLFSTQHNMPNNTSLPLASSLFQQLTITFSLVEISPEANLFYSIYPVLFYSASIYKYVLQQASLILGGCWVRAFQL